MIATIVVIILSVSYFKELRETNLRWIMAKARGELIYMAYGGKTRYYLVADRNERVYMQDDWVYDIKHNKLLSLAAHRYDNERKKMKESSKRYYRPDVTLISHDYLYYDEILARRSDDKFVRLKKIEGKENEFKEIELEKGGFDSGWYYKINEKETDVIVNKKDITIFESRILNRQLTFREWLIGR